MNALARRLAPTDFAWRPPEPELAPPTEHGLEAAEPLLYAEGPEGGLRPLAPPALEGAVALRIAGAAMQGLAEDGALAYFEGPGAPPRTDMLGHVVVAQTWDGAVLARRLLSGGAPGLFDLEALAAPPLRDVKLRWAAHVSAIIPPQQARRILKGSPARNSTFPPTLP